MAIDLKVPAVGESITEVEIGEWKKAQGDTVQKDEPIVILETDKATVELSAPVAGVLFSQLKQKGATALIGEVIGQLEESAGSLPPPNSAAATAAPATGAGTAPPPAGQENAPRVMPAAQRILNQHGLAADQVPATGPGGRLLKEDALREVQKSKELSSLATSSAERPEPHAEATSVSQPSAPAAAIPPPPTTEGRQDEIVPMTRLRRTVAERLVQAQQSAALLTTFNEIDMTGVLGLRKELGEVFHAKYGVKLGFMSFFIKASVEALKQIPQVNAEIRGTDIVYHKYCDIGVAVGGGKGLVVPVLRHAERLSFAEIELTIADLATRARENKLSLQDLQGGTFTISNGGIYGSLLSTPIVNPPQSGVLGMHAIQERPVAREGQVVIRPMMYVALTYDHRLVDGREAVTFLRRVKEVIESPARMLLEV